MVVQSLTTSRRLRPPQLTSSSPSTTSCLQILIQFNFIVPSTSSQIFTVLPIVLAGASSNCLTVDQLTIKVLEDIYSLGHQNCTFSKDKPNANSTFDKYEEQIYEDFSKAIALSNVDYIMDWWKNWTRCASELFSKCSHRHLGYPSKASQSLHVYGFTGLFIIMGTVVIAAILCSEYFIWQGRNRVLSSTGTTTITEQTTFQMINVAEETPTSTSGPNDGNSFNVEAAESEIDIGDYGNENSESGSDEA